MRLIRDRPNPDPPGPVPDAMLLARLAADDSGALDELLQRHWAAVYRLAFRRTGSADQAADIAQDVFCRLWERRGGWKVHGSFRGLLFRLVRNEAVSRFRRARARERAAGTFLHLARAAAQPVDRAERAELRTALERAIAALPARRREVFLLRTADELSYQEIADTLQISKQTVANQIAHALATLRRELAHLLD